MRVLEIGLAPLKGTRHRSLESLELDSRGPVGDRIFGLIDPESRQILKTVTNPSLIAVVVTVDGNLLRVRLPDLVVEGEVTASGASLRVDYWGRPVTVEIVHGPWNRALSEFLGRDMLLVRAPPGSIVYGDPVTVVTTGALRTLRPRERESIAASEEVNGQPDSARFRATFVVETDRTDTSWLGQDLKLGSATVRLTSFVKRCAVIDLNPITGRRDLRLLSMLPRNAVGEPIFGLQGIVTTPGVVSRG